MSVGSNCTGIVPCENVGSEREVTREGQIWFSLWVMGGPILLADGTWRTVVVEWEPALAQWWETRPML